MKTGFVSFLAYGFLAIGCVSCSESTAPTADLALTREPDFTAIVTQAHTESGNAPSGFYISQRVAWVVIQDGSATPAGVVIGSSVPVFRRLGTGRIVAANASSVTLGQKIEVWHDQTVGYGAVQAPPGAPAYGAQQVVIVGG